MPQSDIQTRADIEILVNTFYTKVRANSILGYIFDDVAKINWDTHLPKMYTFWASIVLGEQSYSGNPMLKHIDLSRQTPLSEREFSEWLTVFTQTVDDLYLGPNAEEAKLRAANIARLMLYKIENKNSSKNLV